MRRFAAIPAAVLFSGILFAGLAQEQEPGHEARPEAALTSALVGACRQQPEAFAIYLTATNAAALRAMRASDRATFLQRLVKVGAAGQPLLSNDEQGQTVLRCQSTAGTVLLHIGTAQVEENLAHVRVTVEDGSATDFGLVRQPEGWRIISLGLLVLDIPELTKQWAQQDLEAHERAAIQALQELLGAIATYRDAYGRLPQSLAELGPAPKEGASPEAAQLIDEGLAGGDKYGYRFRYRILNQPEDAPPTYELSAQPDRYNETGKRSFFVDSEGKLHGADHTGGAASADDPELNWPPIE